MLGRREGMESGGEERKVRGAIKKKLEARLYIKKSFVGK